MSTTVENILDVTVLEPKLKHATIFDRFDALQPGDHLIIHNDHDPKPLYYHLKAEKDNGFEWEYLEEGPVWWKVKISIPNLGENRKRIGELAAKDIRKTEVFRAFGLDFSCRHTLTLEEACAENNIHISEVERELQVLDQFPNITSPLFDTWPLDFLMDYIVQNHHAKARRFLPEILKYAQKVEEVHAEQHPELHEVNQTVKAMADELFQHLDKEENKLFPIIKSFVASGKLPDSAPFSSIKSTIDAHEQEHADVYNHLKSIRNLTNNYSLPADACASYRLLFHMLNDFEKDTQIHIHLENNMLFPNAVNLEIKK